VRALQEGTRPLRIRRDRRNGQGPNFRKHPGVVLSLALAAFLTGCTKSPSSQPPEAPASYPAGATSIPAREAGSSSHELRRRVDRAVRLGIAAVLREEHLQVSDIWNLNKFLERYPHDALADFVRKQAEATGDMPFIALIRDTPPIHLPENPGRGLFRFGNLLSAPFGVPEERRIAFLREFLTKDEDGYILTHQLLALEWAKEKHVSLPDELACIRDGFLTRMAAEQARDDVFSDLFAERVALLLVYASPNIRDAEPWIQAILDAQQPDGTWGVLNWTASYDGHTIPVTGTRMHTATLALLALGAFHQRLIEGD
jgi:hypothetical protein